MQLLVYAGNRVRDRQGGKRDGTISMELHVI